MWFSLYFQVLSSEALNDVVKNKKKELKKILELQYGFLDHLVSQGACDLEQVRIIENTESSTLHRNKVVEKLTEKLTSDTMDRGRILEILKRNNQHHVAEFIERGGRKYLPTVQHVMLVVSLCSLLRCMFQ